MGERSCLSNGLNKERERVSVGINREHHSRGRITLDTAGLQFSLLDLTKEGNM